MKKAVLIAVRVEASGTRSDFKMVSPVWGGVDRQVSGGWSVPSKLVDRMIDAIKKGAACPNAKVHTDVSGKTYVNWDIAVMGRHMSRDLERLGF